jgi:hypothetical protein
MANDTLLIDNAYIHGITVLQNADNAKLKKGTHCPDVDKSGSDFGYGIGIDNYNSGWAAMLPYTSGRESNWTHDFYVPCVAFNLMLTSDNMLPAYGATYAWRKNSLDSEIIATTPYYNVTDSATYYLTMDYGNGCVATDNVSVLITSSWIDTTTIAAAICQGTAYTQYNFNETAEGKHYQRLQGVFGCDSVVELTLAYTTLLTDTIRTSICHGGSYYFDGENRTTAGTYNKMSQTIAGCDSLTTLILTTDNIITHTINDEICRGATYNRNGFNVTTEGQHFLSTQTSEGCDSLVTLNLSFYPENTTVFDAVICEGDTYTEHNFNQSISGTYHQNLTGINGCDSTVTLYLAVSPELNISLNQINTACADDTSLSVPFTITSGNIGSYSLSFIEAEFSDIVNQTLVGNTIAIPLPANLRADIYHADLTVYESDCGQVSSYPLEFMVKYSPNIITQRWNDVLSVINATTQKSILYNNTREGDTFEHYQWYKNNVAIPNATNSYYFTPEGLDMNACYAVSLVRTGESQSIMSCEMCPQHITEDIVLRPTIVRGGENINAKIPEDGLVDVYDIAGMKIATFNLNEGENSLKAPNAAGLYLYRVILNSETVRTYKINVIN